MHCIAGIYIKSEKLILFKDLVGGIVWNYHTFALQKKLEKYVCYSKNRRSAI